MIFINHTEDLEGKVVLIELKGALDSETSPDFEDYINQLLLKKKFFVIINAKNLTYISSAGFGVFLYTQKKILSSKGFFIVCNISEEIATIYKMLGFDKIIKLANSKEEALSIMQKQITLIESEMRGKAVIKKEALDSFRAQPEVVKELSNSNSEEESSGEKTFDHPIILECAECKGMIRVKKSGEYICPDCKTGFTVEPDQTVVF
ncbi:MAG: STAS domain-containing protein [Spirochaetota bacterium]